MTGGSSYVQDVRLPGMVFGRVVRPPSYRAQLASFDEAAIKAMPGVVAVARDGSFLAVAAEREEQAIKAAQALRASAKWTETPDLPPPMPALFDHLQQMTSQDIVINQKIAAAPAGGRVTTHEATYRRPFQAHASMAPSCAVAQFKDGKYSVWTHSQGVFPLRGDLVKVLKVPASSITCTHVEGAGCYGHNGADDVALDAALLARATGGRPVKVQWMREDEFGWEPYGSAMVMKMRARLDDSGGIVDWQHEVWSHPHSTRPASTSGGNLLAGWHIAEPVPMGVPANSPQPSGAADRNAVPLYDFPSQKILLHYVTDMPIRMSALRGLGAYANVFALESFMDELAAAAGADPVEFRLRHMKDPRARAVIETCAQKAGWKPGQKGDGAHGRGIAFAKYKNLAAYCAVVADVDGGPPHRQGARDEGGIGRGCRAHHQSRRRGEPDRGRHHPVGELDAEGARRLRPPAHHDALVGRLPDPDLPRSARGRGAPHQPSRGAPAGQRRRLAGPDRRGDRQRGRPRDRRAHPRPALLRRKRVLAALAETKSRAA